MDIKSILEKRNISPDPLKDQFFLIDDSIVEKMVELAELNKKDIVLEVGAGVGNLTKELAKKAGRVIAFEIDERFKPELLNLPKNVDLRMEDAWAYIQLDGKKLKRKQYNKVVANLPFSFAEKFLHNLTFLIYDKVILLIPISLSKKIETNAIFSSFFKVEEKLIVEKNNFFPIPDTTSVVIDLVKLPDPIKSKNLALFLRQFIYQYEQTKVKNSLREGLIKFVLLSKNKKLTKKEAKFIIDQSGINKELIETIPTGFEVYEQISEKFPNIIFSEPKSK